MSRIESIKIDDHMNNLVVVKTDDGAQMRYLMGQDGVLRPGRVWQSMTGPDHQNQYTVTFFIPLPDGPPEILNVRAL